ncbi:MAG: hypothetical protein JXB04_11440 [Kiritimatiellae bacterium]|nr:hypothetical protein [Kiritimatiellia bacterium]
MRVRILFAAGALLGCAALAEEAGTSAEARPARAEPRYTGRVTMHETPFDVELPEEPDSRVITPRGVPDALPAGSDDMPLTTMSQPYMPALRRLPDRESKKKSNWVVPSAPEGGETEEAVEPSGWGWLADGAEKFRRQHEAAQEKEAEATSGDMRTEDGLPAASRSTAGRAWMDTSFQPAAGTEPVSGITRFEDDRDPRSRGAEEAAAEAAEQEAAGSRAEAAGYGHDYGEGRQRDDRGSGGNYVWGGVTPDGRQRSTEWGLTRSDALLAQIRSDLPKTTAPTLRDELGRYREMMAQSGASGAGQPAGGADAGKQLQSLNPLAAPAGQSILGAPTPSASAPVSLLPQAASPGWSSQSMESRFGALPGSSAMKALQPYQPTAPFTPLSDPWSSGGGAAASGAGSAQQPLLQPGFGLR